MLAFNFHLPTRGVNLLNRCVLKACSHLPSTCFAENLHSCSLRRAPFSRVFIHKRKANKICGRISSTRLLSHVSLALAAPSILASVIIETLWNVNAEKVGSPSERKKEGHFKSEKRLQ